MSKGSYKKSMKDRPDTKRKTAVDKKTHLGKLMSKHRDVDEVLYPYVSNVGMVYDDMDFTIEEFADITGADISDLINDISAVIK